MNAAPPGTWTQERFFAWSGHGKARYEFDGERPVAMTGDSVNHSAITVNLLAPFVAVCGGVSAVPSVRTRVWRRPAGPSGIRMLW
ncbi:MULTISPECIES: hypothetical protein [unclassified Acidisoma]|jgi:hypothetical protein|uniref:hypothetical protein n=1 Tax=unclassified Acidisoma TaxID=2634065 RepID=UPI00131CA5A0|nr:MULTISPECIES: hypothetical protein [unclassified Acidisoma]